MATSSRRPKPTSSGPKRRSGPSSAGALELLFAWLLPMDQRSNVPDAALRVDFAPLTEFLHEAELEQLRDGGIPPRVVPPPLPTGERQAQAYGAACAHGRRHSQARALWGRRVSSPPKRRRLAMQTMGLRVDARADADGDGDDAHPRPRARSHTDGPPTVLSEGGPSAISLVERSGLRRRRSASRPVGRLRVDVAEAEESRATTTSSGPGQGSRPRTRSLSRGRVA